MKFFLASYQLVSQETGEVMVAELVKETEQRAKPSILHHNKVEYQKVGIAGTLTLHIYDAATIERMKSLLGKEVDVDVRI